MIQFYCHVTGLWSRVRTVLRFIVKDLISLKLVSADLKQLCMQVTESVFTVMCVCVCCVRGGLQFDRKTLFLKSY